MGLRDRLKEKVKGLVGLGSPPASTHPPGPPAPAPEKAPVPPPPAPAPEKAPVPPPPPSREPAAFVASSPPVAPPPASPAPSAEKSVVEDAASSEALRSGNDAPTRAAHLRPIFSHSGRAFSVRVYNQTEKLDIRFPCEPGEFVVEAAERAGFELPSSCRNGGCLTCTGKLMEGEAEIIEDQYVLEDHQIAAGFRLLCITTPKSDATFLSHQQEEL